MLPKDTAASKIEKSSCSWLGTWFQSIFNRLSLRMGLPQGKSDKEPFIIVYCVKYALLCVFRTRSVPTNPRGVSFVLEWLFRFLPLDDLLPISETGFNQKDKLLRLSWYSGGYVFCFSVHFIEFRGDCLFLPTDGCEILDQERAELLFGKTDLFENKTKIE